MHERVSDADFEDIALPMTADDITDQWLRETGGQVPGGEYIGYPVETSDRPSWPVDSLEDREHRRANAQRIYAQEIGITPEELAELVANAKKANEDWLKQRRDNQPQ